MANIMIRQADNGGLTFYLPKRDLEASISSIEFDTQEKWGGELKLDNGGDCKPVCPTKSISSGKIYFKIDVGTCTECEGESDSPMCVDVCPSGCIVPA